MLSIELLADSLQLLMSELDALSKAVIIGCKLRLELADFANVAFLLTSQVLYLACISLTCFLELQANTKL